MKIYSPLPLSIHPPTITEADLPVKWRTCKRNGALSNVEMKDAPVNTPRFFEAFAFMSLAQIRLQTQNTLFLNAFDVWRLRGIASALRLAMLTKNEKLTDSGLADTSASENALFSMKL